MCFSKPHTIVNTSVILLKHNIDCSLHWIIVNELFYTIVLTNIEHRTFCHKSYKISAMNCFLICLSTLET